MIIKGIIKSIDYNGNTCVVRLPLFEGAGNTEEVILPAIIVSQPGIFNGYKENDVVLVSFENKNISNPIVLGKLFLGTAVENAESRGAINVTSLNVTNTASLPITTKLSFEGNTEDVVGVNNDYSSYKTLADIVKALQKTELQFNKNDLELDNQINEIKVSYLQTSKNPTEFIPVVDDLAWQSSMPTWKDEYFIWQKTACYNRRGKIVGQPEIICLSSLATTASYWLKCSTRTHAGEQQKEVIDIVAMVKLGSATETKDESATLEYKWGIDGEVIVSNNRITLSHPDIQNKNLIITAKRNGVIYESETITFSPLNTPTLILSNESSILEYDSYGYTKINAEDFVESTASVVLNNKEVENVKFSWNLNNTCVADSETDLDTATIKITDINEEVDIATATCTATYIDNVGNEAVLTKTFSIAKNRQGKSVYKIDISNDFVTIPAIDKGNNNISIPDDFDWELLTKHSISALYGDEPISFTCSQEEPKTNASVKNYHLKYTLTNLELESSITSNVNSPKYEVVLSNLTGKLGIILYELYRGNTKVASAKFEATRLDPGIAATSYWVVISAPIHTGSRQEEDILIQPKIEIGNSGEDNDILAYIRCKYAGEENFFAQGIGEVTIKAPLKDKNILVEVSHTEDFTDIYESETITFSPLNSPVLDLSNDSAAITYTPNNSKIGEENVYSKATLYLNGKEVTDVTYNWTLNGCKAANTEATTITSQDIEIEFLEDSQATATCSVTYKGTTYSKVFSITKQIQGDASTIYWLKTSCVVHTGSNQESEIVVTAMEKTGIETEKEDIDAKLYYRYHSDSKWLPTTNATNKLEISTYKNEDLYILATHDSEFIPTIDTLKSESEIYDWETITYSPLNTPVLDLDNDNDTLTYSAENKKIEVEGKTNTVSSTASMYLNGDILEGATYEWTFEGCTGIVSNNNQTATVSDIEADTLVAKATCKATYKGKSYTKVFSIVKQISAVTYWIKTSRPTHTGETQTVAIRIIAMKKEGTNPETLDNEAFLWWKYKETSTEWTSALAATSHLLEFETTDILNEDLIILATHKKDFVPDINTTDETSVDIYDWETITYSPLNTPIVDLSNDSASLVYDAEGNKIGNNTVKSKATLYLNGEAINDSLVEYSWADPENECVFEGDTNTAEIQVKEITSNIATVTCTIEIKEEGLDGNGQFAGKTYIKDFTISRQIKGDSTVSYWLMPSTTTIVRAATGEIFPQEIAFSVLKKSGLKEPKLVKANDENLNLKVKRDLEEIAATFNSTETNYTITTTNVDKQMVIELYSGNLLIDKETINVIKDGTNAESPYFLDISNDKVSALSNTTTLIDYNWAENTLHKVKVLQGADPVALTNINVYNSADITVATIADPLFITYELVNIKDLAENLNESNINEKAFYIEESEDEGLVDTTKLSGTVKYTLYSKGKAVSTAKFEFLKILFGEDGTSITSVANKYWATTTATLTEEDKATEWKNSIEETGYGPTKPYLWNYEVISYSNDTSINTEIALLGSYGKGIVKITEYYYTTDSSDSSKLPALAEWSEGTPIQPDSSKPFLWNRELIEYSTGEADNELSEPVIIGTYGETFGVIIESNVASIKMKEKLGSTTEYAPKELSVVFKEVSGTTTILCSEQTKREYKFQIWRYTDGVKEATPFITGNLNSEENPDSSYKFTISENVTSSYYQIDLCLKNEEEWIVVDSENIPVVREGVDATSYWVNVPVDVHTGIAQTEDIVITAYSKNGLNPEEVDKTANIYINNVLKSEKTGSYTLTAEEIGKNYATTAIIITVKHGNDVYDTEIIDYSPNTPILTLTNDSAVLKENESATTTAKLYLSGKPITDGVSFEWNTSPKQDTATLTVAESSLTATTTFTCKASYNGQTYTKDFVVTKVIDATSYWVDVTADVHTGIEQLNDIIIKAYKKEGMKTEEVDTSADIYINGELKSSSNTGTYTIRAADIKTTYAKTNINIVVKHKTVEFDTETIEYSPSTPIVALSNDSASIKKGETVTTTAKLYVKGEDFSSKATFKWKNGETILNETSTLTIEGENVGAISSYDCIVTYNGNTYTKTFTVTKVSDGTNGDSPYIKNGTWWIGTVDTEIKAEAVDGQTPTIEVIDGYWYINGESTSVKAEGIDATSYWIKSSCTVHTGQNHGQNVVVTAMKKTGTSNEAEDSGENGAYLWWRYASISTWALAAAKFRINFTFPTEVPNDDMIVIATHSSSFNPNAEGVDVNTDTNIYDRETITYSPLNTPVLDLDNDSASLAYLADGTKLGDDNDSVTTTATLYLNGEPLEARYDWECDDCNKDQSIENSASITITTLENNIATATCKATVLDGPFKNKTYSKVFSITKQIKGEQGIQGLKGEDAESPYVIDILNDKVTVLTNTLTLPSDYNWQNNTSHTIRVLYGASSIDLFDSEGNSVIAFKAGSDYTPSSTDGLVITYTLTNISQLQSSNDINNVKEKVCYISDLDEGKTQGTILYKLYLRGSLIATAKFEFLKILFGENGRSIVGVKNYYLTTTTKEVRITHETEGWVDSISKAEFSAINKYLWNYEEIEYDLPLDGELTTKTTPEIISAWSKSIDKIEEYYLISKTNNSNNFEANKYNDWSKEAVAPNSTYPYLWNKEIIYYTDGTNTESTAIPVIIGTYGETFGVNIEPNVASIKLAEVGTDLVYTPTKLSINFKEVAGTNVINCGESKRNYKYRIYSIVGDSKETIISDTSLTAATSTAEFNIAEKPTTGFYQVELLIKNDENWVVVDTENIPVVREGKDAEAPYVIDIYNDRISALTNTAKLDSSYNLATETVHKVKVLQGAEIKDPSKITFKQAPYTPAETDEDLVLIYKLTGISSINYSDDTTSNEKSCYISALSSDEVMTATIEYTLYLNSRAIATSKFEFLKVLFGENGRGIKNVTNYYLATVSEEEKPEYTNSNWKEKLSDLSPSYDRDAPYLWNYELITYDTFEEDGVTPETSKTNIELINYWAQDGASNYTISISNNFATIPNNIVSNQLYRASKFTPANKGYELTQIEAVTRAVSKKLPGMTLKRVIETSDLHKSLVELPIEPIQITPALPEEPTITKSYIQDLTNHTVKVYYGATAEILTEDNFILKLDHENVNTANMPDGKYLVCEIGAFDKNGTLVTDDFPGMNPTVANNTVSNYITAASGSENLSSNVYITYTYYVDREAVATSKFELTRALGPTTYYMTPSATSIKISKENTATPTSIEFKAYQLSTSDNSVKDFTTGKWEYYWNNNSDNKTTYSGQTLVIAETDTLKFDNYNTLTVELYNGSQLWDRETIEILKDGVGIAEIIELYQTTSDSTSEPTKPDKAEETDWKAKKWETTPVQPNATDPYLWNVEIIKYTNGDNIISNPAIIGTYGETFGVNIIPSVSSIIKKENSDGSLTYIPSNLGLKFNEVAGNTVTPCSKSKRKYKFQIWRYIKDPNTGEIIKETDPTVAPFAEDTLDRTKVNSETDKAELIYPDASYEFNIASKPTESHYQVDLCIWEQTTQSYIVVDSENIPVVREGRDGIDGLSTEVLNAFYIIQDYPASINWLPGLPEASGESGSPLANVQILLLDDNQYPVGGWFTFSDSNVPNLEEMPEGWKICYTTKIKKITNTNNEAVGWGTWEVPTIYAVADEKAYNVLKVSEGLFGYGQGVYFTYDPPRDENGNILNQDDPGLGYPPSILIAGTAYEAGTQITKTQLEIADWIINGDIEVNEYVNLDSVEERKEVIKLYIDAEYIRTGTLTVGSVDKPLLQAGLDGEGSVKIAGFDITNNTLTTGVQSDGNLIKLSSENENYYKYIVRDLDSTEIENDENLKNSNISIYGFKKLTEIEEIDNKPYLKYMSTNKGIDKSYSVAKIIFKQNISTFDLYIQSNSEEYYDFMVASRLSTATNPQSIPTGLGVEDEDEASLEFLYDLVQETTAGKKQTKLMKVTYNNIAADDFIYLIYNKDNGVNENDDTGWFYLPANIRLTIGDNFQVLADGTVYASNLFLGNDLKEAGGKFEALVADINRLDAKEIVTNKIEIKDVAGENTLFKADGTAANDDERVQIGGFRVTPSYIHSDRQLSGDFIEDDSSQYINAGVGIQAPTNSLVTETDLAIWAGPQSGDGTLEKPYGFDAPFKIDYTGNMTCNSGQVGNFWFENSTIKDVGEWTILSTGQLKHTTTAGPVMADPATGMAITSTHHTYTQTFTIGRSSFDLGYNNKNKQLSLQTQTFQITKRDFQTTKAGVLPITPKFIITQDDIDSQALTSTNTTSTVIEPSYIKTTSLRADKFSTQDGKYIFRLTSESDDSTNFSIYLKLQVKDNNSNHATIYLRIIDENGEIVTDSTLTEKLITINKVTARIAKLKDNWNYWFGEETEVSMSKTDGKAEWTRSISSRWGLWNTRTANFAAFTLGYSINGAAQPDLQYSIGTPGYAGAKTWTSNYTNAISIDANTIYQIVPAVSNSSSGVDLGKDGYRFRNLWAKAVYNASGIIGNSDLNLKNTINSIDSDLRYDKLFNSLTPVSYKFNDGTSNRTHTGLIAQDLKQSILDAGFTTQDVAAYCEWETEDENTKEKITTCGIRYEELIPLNIYEIQKLKKRVSEQEVIISTLEARIKNLEDKH